MSRADPDWAMTRLYVPEDLGVGARVVLDAGQAHQLRSVLRLEPGRAIALFNGRDGEFLARIEELSRDRGTTVCEAMRRAQPAAGGPWLLFAPVKRGPIEFLIEKATELGVGLLQPVATRHTQADRLNLDRLGARAREAAEQSERLDVPVLRPLASLGTVLAAHPPGRLLYLCDETGRAPPLPSVPPPSLGGWSVMIGPEGGFAPDELDLMRGLAFVKPVGLGPRVLRSETAGLAALAVLQAMDGTWSEARVQVSA